jgi:hypothetical protein
VDEKLESLKKHSESIIDSTMKPHNEYKLYTQIKEQVPGSILGRNRPLPQNRLNITMPSDYNSAISVASKSKKGVGKLSIVM